MIDENFRRLFIATHLLYPNSAQARDIVFQISTQLRAKIEKSESNEQLSIYFSALVQIFRRVSTIKSGFKFFEFKDQKLNDWKNILKKCNTNEILIFLGIAVLKIEVADIARVLKFSPNQVRYLFGLAIRKVVGGSENTDGGLTQPRPVVFKFRHFTDSDVTYSNLLEKVIDYVFLGVDKSQKVSFDGFSKFNQIHISERNQGNIGFLFSKISALASELADIEIDEPFLVEFQKEAKTFSQKSRLQIKLEWRWVGVISVITISLMMFFLRPDFRQIFVQDTTVAAIEVKEIAFKVAENRPTEDVVPLAASQPIDPDLISIDVNPVTPIVAVKIPGPSMIGDNRSDAKPTEPTSISKNDDVKKPVVEAVAAKVDPVVAAKNDSLAKAETVNPVQAAADPSVMPLPANGIAPTESTTATSADSNPSVQQAPGKPSTGVYRAELFVRDLEQMSTFTKERIVGFGGKKAGEVELGWVKNPKTTYFHFELPEENVEKLKTDLAKLGQLKISFHSHPRLMPAGSKRIILEVKQGD